VRICILSQYYPPEMGAPQARLSHLAGQFAQQGHDVVVLTAMPNYPRGSVFPGYGGFLRREFLSGVSVIRCWIYPTQKVGLAPRLASYFSFVLSSVLIGLFSVGKVDCLLTESPPLFLGISGYILSRRWGARWIFNVSDLWPESAVRLGAVSEGWGLRAAVALEAFCYRKAWLVTGQSQGILDSIRQRFPLASVYHLSNGVDTDLFRPERRRENERFRLIDGGDPDRACVAMYAGLHGIAQGLDQVLEVAARLHDLETLWFVLVGDGPEKQRLIERSRAMGLSRVRFLDALPREEMPVLLASADISIIPLKMSLPGAVPSKIYEAMGAGVPIVLIASGEAATLVRRSGAGMVVEPGDVDEVASAIRNLAGNPEARSRMGRAGREAALRDFDRCQIARCFMRHLESGIAC
jgi:colanic acid biosynthesis glycosyl transferase WcaI